MHIEMLGDGNDLAHWLEQARDYEASAAAKASESENGGDTHPQSVA
jgi:hypothetical protein